MSLVKVVSTPKDYLVRFLNGLGEVFDAAAGLAPEPWDKIFGFVITAGAAVGFLHVVNPGALVTSLTNFVLAVAAVGAAGGALVAVVMKAVKS